MFTDINECSYPAVIEQAAKEGLVAGYPDGSFRPKQNVTREEVVYFIMRAVAKMDLDNKIKSLVEKYRTGVVKINGRYKTGSETWEATASGSFLTQTGYILTCKHVTDFGVRFDVETAFGMLPGKFVVDAGSMMVEDSSVDLAIIKVSLPAGAKPAIIPWSWVQPPKGNFCITMGSPLGLKGTVNFGMVSNSQIDEWIQVDSPINPGNSGGVTVLVDGGTAIGVPTWKSGGDFVDNIGFLTPGDVVKKFLDAKFRP